MELTYDTNLFRIDSDIFHATKEIQYPPLFKLMMDIKSQLEINNDIVYLDSFYIEFKHNLGNFNQSYNFDSETFTDLVNVNISLLSEINDKHQLTLDLIFIKLLLQYRVDSITFLKKLNYQMMLFSQNQEPSFDLSNSIKKGGIDKALLPMAIFMQPVIIDKQKEREYYLGIINTIEEGEELYPIKQNLIDSIVNFHSTTNADLILQFVQLIQQSLTTMLDKYITDKFNILLLLNEDITETSKSETFLDKMSLLNTMVSNKLIEEINISSQIVLYATNNSAQNLPVRDEQLAEDIILVNLDNESKVNTAVVADNTNQVVIAMKLNNLEIINENNILISSSNQLEISSQLLNDELTKLNTDQNYLISDEIMVHEKIKIDTNIQQIATSTNTIKSKSLEQNILMNNYKKILSQNKEVNPKLVNPLKSLNSQASNTMTNTELIMGMSKDNISITSISLDNTLLTVEAISITSYINNAIDANFSLLKLPIQSVLSITNELICLFEALQCLAVGLAKGILELTEFLTDLALIQFEFDNLDNSLLQIVEDLKTSIMDKWNNSIFSSGCSSLTSVAISQKEEIKELLQDNSEYASDWSITAQEACAEWIATISQDILDQIANEFVLFVDELKDAMQQTVDNMFGLLDTSECRAIDMIPDLDLNTDFDGINVFDITSPDLKFPNFRVEMPKVKLKVKPC